MAIIVETTQAERLVSLIQEAIDDGSVRTWSYDTDGDFTHTAEQWNRAAWLRPAAGDRLVFNILAPRGVQLSRVVYAIYHGRFIEMLLTHFDQRFSSARATAMPTAGDRVGP